MGLQSVYALMEYLKMQNPRNDAIPWEVSAMFVQLWEIEKMQK